MKALIIILIFFMNIWSTFSQTGEVSTLAIDWNDTTVFVPKQTDFLGYTIGWVKAVRP